MTDTGSATARFDFGRVVGQTFGLIGRNFILFVFLALVFVGLPQFGVLYAQSWAATSADTSLIVWITLGGIVVSLITTYILQGAITRATIDDLSGAGVSSGAAVADGLRYFFPLFVVALLVWLGMVAGLLLLIVPGLILAVRWSVTAPVVVVERHGPTRSMGRSAELTENNRWAIFGLLVLYILLAYAAQIVTALVFAAFGGNLIEATQAVGRDTAGWAYMIGTAVVAALITLISTTGTAALYFELRRVKEGVGVDELAKVFE